jgi:8-oxo-dGTP diphosphatase
MDVVNLCVIKPNKSQVLLVNRANSPYQGYWGLLGGKVKRGENSSYAAVRELREECGLVRELKAPPGHLC